MGLKKAFRPFLLLGRLTFEAKNKQQSNFFPAFLQLNQRRKRDKKSSSKRLFTRESGKKRRKLTTFPLLIESKLFEGL